MQLIKTHTKFQTESELLAGCKQNDRKAQKCLFEKYKNSMFSIALRITGNSDFAHDALQEAFIDVFEGIDDFRSESTLGAWIKTIVIRKALRWLKFEKQHEQLDEVDNVECIETDFDFTAADLDKAIQSLPESARTVFLLIKVEGYKHQDVADFLGVSVGTTKSQLNYSKKLLQRRLYEKV
jgi:RNA polymerase sigma factor (sigma-70 family)